MVKLSVDCEIQKETPGYDDFRDFIVLGLLRYNYGDFRVNM